MKKIFTILLVLFISIPAFSQGDKKGDKREKIKALKIAHITEQLDLTEEEAQVFWPIYNAHEENQEKLMRSSMEKRKKKNPEDLTETEAKTLLLEMISIEKEKQESHEAYVNKLLEILPAKKVIKLMQADRSFRRRMIERFKDMHKGKRREHP